MSGVLSLSYRDYDGEVSNVRFPVATVTAANFDAQAALHTALKNALEDIVKGQRAKESLINESIVSLANAADQDAQRELKWLVSYYAADNIMRSIELPCADLTALDANDRAHAAIGDADVVDAFVAAFEAVIKVNGVSTVTVKEITLVGRPI
jgi:hypothetical protein